MAGYSGTPLPQKLGIKPGCRLALANAPADAARILGTLPEGVVAADAARGRGPFDVMICFVTAAARLPGAFAKLRPKMDPACGLWIAWPKKSAQKSSGVATDVTEGVVREVGLSSGLVDNKVCAIDDVWSGLRFVVRVADRPARR